MGLKRAPASAEGALWNQGGGRPDALYPPLHHTFHLKEYVRLFSLLLVVQGHQAVGRLGVKCAHRYMYLLSGYQLSGSFLSCLQAEQLEGRQLIPLRIMTCKGILRDLGHTAPR